MVRIASSRDSRIPALDGIRALAIAAVVAFHMGVVQVPGGFLGVDIFFVLSGYLITWILLDRITYFGRIDFKEFYLARARRLLPAFAFLALGIAIGVGLWAPDTIGVFLRDLPWAATGLTNWWFIFQQHDYFAEIGRPSLLQHTWSLAIEAQFYAVWPLLITVIARFLHIGYVRFAAIVGAVASWAALLWVGQTSDTSAVSASHLYFGTDTHSSGLFIGAALAVAWIPRNLHNEISDGARHLLNAVGFVGLAGLLWAVINVDESTGRFFTVGFPLVGIATAMLTAAAVHPASAVSRLLGNRVFQWLGTRSYGLYLWHWVIIQVLRPGLDVLAPTPVVVALQVALMLGITEFSYRFVELPVRRGLVRRVVRGLRFQTTRTKALAAAFGAVVFVTPLVSAAAIDRNAVAVSAADAKAARQIVVIAPGDIEKVGTQPKQSTNIPDHYPLKPRKVWVFGDSVVLGARNGFTQAFDLAGFQAGVGDQAFITIRQVRAYALKFDQGQHDVVFDIGNNGTLTDAHLPKISKALKSAPRIVIVNTAVPRPWKAHNNRLIAQWVAQHPAQVRLADWATASAGHPEYFVRDGVHLTQAGVRAYLACIQAAYSQP